MPIQVLKGTTTNRAAITPLEAELVFDTDELRLYIGDGATAGGIPVSGVGTALSSGSYLVGDSSGTAAETTALIGSMVASNGDMYINIDGPDGSSRLYFYEGGASNGAYILWDDGPGRFTMSDGLRISGDTESEGDVYVNVAGPDGSSYIYFYDASSKTGQHIAWDDVNSRFSMSSGLSVTGLFTCAGYSAYASNFCSNNDLYVNNNGPDGDSFIYFYDGSSPTGQYIRWYPAGPNFRTSAGLYVGGVLESGGNLEVRPNDVFIGYAGNTGNKSIYFYDTTVTGQWIRWNETLARFEASTSFSVKGNLYVNYDGSAGDGAIYFFESGTTYAARLYWDNAESVLSMDQPLAVDEIRGIPQSLQFVLDGAGSALAAGVALDIVVPYDMTVTSWTILGDQTGSIVVDLWQDSYASYPPTVADTITGSEKPTLSSATSNQDTSLASGSGWSLTKGSILRVNVDSASTVTRVTISLDGVRA